MTAFNIHKYQLISDQVSHHELEIICKNLISILDKDIRGDVVEFGCYIGTTSLFIQRILQSRRSAKRLHVYDSFAGLPAKGPQDSSPAGEQFAPGSLAASKTELIHNFRRAGLPLPRIHKAWFADLQPSDIPDMIAFAFLDGDFYDSIIDPWNLIKNRLSRGAVLIVDDYGNLALPGARRAANRIASDWGAQIREINSLAIMSK